MDKEIVVRLHSSFEEMVQTFPDTGTEFWCARELQNLLGYAKWENFAKVADKAITSYQNASYGPKGHCLDIKKMVGSGSGVKREIALQFCRLGSTRRVAEQHHARDQSLANSALVN